MQKEPDVYEFNHVAFGVNSSRFQAQFVTHQHALKNQDDYPLGAEPIIKSTYMDDSMDSVPDVKTGGRLYEELSALWDSAGMHARKWLSNSPELLQSIPSSDCVKYVDLDKGELPSVKTLGILWSPKEDTFTFRVKVPQQEGLPCR